MTVKNDISKIKLIISDKTPNIYTAQSYSIMHPDKKYGFIILLPTLTS